MYLKYNSNLLYHGCIPVNEDGTFGDLEEKFQKLNEPNQNFRTKKALPIPEEKKKAHGDK